MDQEGGAERIAYSLFDGFRNRGHASWLAVGIKRTKDPDVFVIPYAQEARNRWARVWWSAYAHAAKLHGGGGGWRERFRRALALMAAPSGIMDTLRGRETSNFPGTSEILDLPPEAPDLLQVHSLQRWYFDLEALPALSSRIPTVLTLHDAWLLSGHCMHSFDCERWRHGCGECPDLKIPPAVLRDNTRWNWMRKASIFAGSRLWIATPSHWLMDKVQASMLRAEGSMVIPNGVDTVNFRPGAQALARRALSLPEDARILLAVAHRIRSSPWKDFALLEKAFGIVCRRAPSENTILLVVGDAGIDQADRGAGLRYIPPLGDDSKMAMAYQAADLYVHPAKADTFPTTVLEAMACGLPVVATSVGGIPEQVVEGETGSLVPAGDPEALAIRILELLNNAHRRQSMGRNAAVRAQQLYTRPRMIDAYLAWYEEILGGARARENLQ